MSESFARHLGWPAAALDPTGAPFTVVASLGWPGAPGNGVPRETGSGVSHETQSLRDNARSTTPAGDAPDIPQQEGIPTVQGDWQATPLGEVQATPLGDVQEGDSPADDTRPSATGTGGVGVATNDDVPRETGPILDNAPRRLGSVSGEPEPLAAGAAAQTAKRAVPRETGPPQKQNDPRSTDSIARPHRKIGVKDLGHSWTGTRVVTVSNQKGGVGKTTTAVNIAAAMAQSGLRVLVIDMDPQGNASTALSIPHLSGTPGIYNVLIDGVPLADVVQPCPQIPGLSCAPATIDLAGAEIELVPLVARENRLRRALSTYLEELETPPDLVVIDCPPSLGLLTVNAFVAAREVLIPIQCEYYALEGLSQLLKNVELIQQHLNADLRVSTILLTMFDGRTKLASDVADQVREYFGQRVLESVVPRSVRISEAPSHGETVMTYDPGSNGALAYADAAVEMRRQEVAL